MSNAMLVGLPEIASFLRCSVRKLHDPTIKNEMIEKKVIFLKQGKAYGQEVWAAFESDLIQYVKDRAARGNPF